MENQFRTIGNRSSDKFVFVKDQDTAVVIFLVRLGPLVVRKRNDFFGTRVFADPRLFHINIWMLISI